MDGKGALQVTAAVGAIRELEENARRLYLELLLVDGRLPDVPGRVGELRDLVDELEGRLAEVAEGRLTAMTRALGEEARVLGEDEEDFVVARLEERGEQDRRAQEALVAAEGRGQLHALRK